MLIGIFDNNLIIKEKVTNNKQVEIFIIPNWPWSERAIRMLRTLQAEHEIKVIKNDKDFKSFNKSTNYTSFSQIYINWQFINGYSDLVELHSSRKLKDW